MRKPENYIDPKDVIRTLSVESLCDTADQFFQFVRADNPLIAKGKPFSDLNGVSDTLQNMSHLLAGLRLGKSMTVLDFAAGTCWLSRFLMQLQCRVIACDVSQTALEMGQELIAEFPPPGENMFPPTFLKFDGHRIEQPDESVDRVVCHDGFHHIPNQETVLAEISRVLVPGGIAAFSEPGRFHSQSPESQHDMRTFNVLENDILLPEIKATAEKHGFTDIRIKPICNIDIPMQAYEELTSNKRRTRSGKAILEHVRHLLNYRTIFFLHKGEFIADSRAPEGLSYSMHTDKRRLQVKANVPFEIPLTVTNTGHARWITESPRDTGVVRVGTQLIQEAAGSEKAYGPRFSFERPVSPGETLDMSLRMALEQPGKYTLLIDLVSERVCWFGDQGAEVLKLDIHVMDD